jgi:S1-C subfamily serine protease
VRCGAKTVVQLRVGEVCPDCASAEAWEEYARPGPRLVVDEASITEALARRRGKRRSWLPAAPCLLALAASAAGLSVSVTLFSSRPPGPLAPMMDEIASTSRLGLWLGAAGVALGILALVFLRRSRLLRAWWLTAIAGGAMAAGTASAAVASVELLRLSGLRSWQYMAMPPRSAAFVNLPDIERIMAATVVLLAPDSSGNARRPAIGTGSVIQAEKGKAWIVTCSHVVMPYVAPAAPRFASRAHPVWACFADGREAEGRVRWTGEPPLDVALVSVEIEDPPGPIRTSRDGSEATDGSAVHFVPNPLRDGWLLHRGTVSARRSHLTPAGRFSLVITDLPVQPGDSGSGLFDAQHRLVGVNTWRSVDESGPAGISLPSETIRVILDLIERDDLSSLESRR